jgi:hypothetical protein
MNIENFYRGQWVRYVDKKYNGHFTLNSWFDGNVHYEVIYGKDNKKGHSWTQPDLNYGDLCQVVLPQATPTGVIVKNQKGQDVVSLWEWFVDDTEWKNQNRTDLIDKILEK